MKRLGLDIGSTTLKCAVLDEAGDVRYTVYRRHLSRIPEVAAEIFAEMREKFPADSFSVTLSGSAGMGIAEAAGLPFVQEVYAEKLAVNHYCPNTDVVIELGGEDAKILFLTGGFEMRMNGTCAGGTGAFIDQMAALMKITPDELNNLAAHHEKIYTIASRCGVFAKSDVQPLLNQGARKEDIAAGILYAVVNQTVAGLSQGRRIEGKVLYLGGPLSFLPELRKGFDDVLKTQGTCPENALCFVALGAALSGMGKEMTLAELADIFGSRLATKGFRHCQPLFRSREDYQAFLDRHERASGGITVLEKPKNEMFLGIDAGSTTVKLVLCDRDGNICEPFYSSNNGNPVPLVRDYLERIYTAYPDLSIAGAAVTGYGEEIIRNAFGADLGIVETVAHFTAAKKFRPDVDFILDIGGQDIKCFHIRNGAIDSLYLNEACSSGCGSFLQTFAAALGYTPEQFAKLGLFADAPVDLGSRCTVFMNSSVKQAQKDGASIENIAAGLSVSVVKNALYKVIRCANAESLGKHIVAQGGTFLNDCVLRAFEQEIGADVIRPKFAPLMGAYGAALFALENVHGQSGIIDRAGLREFHHEAKAFNCSGCANHCALTVNTFSGGRKYIAGNRCSKPLGTAAAKEVYNLYDYKRQLLGAFMKNEHDPARRTVGIPMGLNFYELLPFWHTFLSELGFNVLVSPFSSHGLYRSGQYTIPSDTACYPAKMMHGHIEWLLAHNPDAILYPDMSYNVDEGLGVNHYNCPVVAYYPQVLKLNVAELSKTDFIDEFVSLADPKQFTGRITAIMRSHFPDLGKRQISQAVRAAYAAYDSYLTAVRVKGAEFRAIAKRDNKPVVVLAGRPYHVDPEINHGIDTLLCNLGAVVVTEDSLSALVEPFPTGVRNQWTYHARLYAAAKYIAGLPADDPTYLVQLVSFGCGVDAVTTDEVRSILESVGRVYTQIKIDEVSNMGAVTIRLRSLFAMMRRG